MIFLIDHVLPDSYFANNLRALSVDMAVFRELLRFKLPELAQHLDKLQKTANDGMSGKAKHVVTRVVLRPCHTRQLLQTTWRLALVTDVTPQGLLIVRNHTCMAVRVCTNVHLTSYFSALNSEG